MRDLKNVTFETNTTQKLHKDFVDYLNNQDRFEITWSCSPKLSVSGEPWETAILPDVASEYSSVDGSDMYPKFVVFTNDDFDEVTRAVEEYRNAVLNVPIILCTWEDVPEEYSPNVKEVAEACMERGWRFPPVLDMTFLFRNAWGT